eukprot:CAMPEP_0181201248 /NCGR_PEP_ID=MMETSP1096-20121128/18203_1 /TAXON_ID=156174 ORGANISM="Chrysochromulina ericina, Strain CCMP281" /NCGR_SAMPLE_ID=MMETSP1096 /ASSEMBLY_ACC=CAM_ASM_000453 /LENGTH=53 /DNA_ID=CAMNT_0023291673 /DNA_START=755 /DNA_END=914 /DNA_ORIENTATION=-
MAKRAELDVSTASEAAERRLALDDTLRGRPDDWNRPTGPELHRLSSRMKVELL